MPDWLNKVGGYALGGLQTASDALSGARYLLAPDASEQSGDALQDAAGRPTVEKSARGFLDNLGPSAVKLLGGTVKGSYDLLSNAIQAQSNPAKFYGELGANPAVQAAVMHPGRTATAAKDALAKRYGGLEALGNTAYEDPFGLASDVATVATLGGGALAEAPGILGRVGRGVSAAGAAIDPIAQLSKAAALDRAPAAVADHLEDLPLGIRASAEVPHGELPPAREWTPPAVDAADLPAAREWKPRPRPPQDGAGLPFDEAPTELPFITDDELKAPLHAIEWTPKAGPDVVAPRRIPKVDAIDLDKYASAKQALTERFAPHKAERLHLGYPELPLIPERPATNARGGTARYGIGLDREGKIAERERLVAEGLEKARAVYADAPHLAEGLERGLATTHPRTFAHSTTGRQVGAGEVANYTSFPEQAGDVKVGQINMSPKRTPDVETAEGVAYHEGGMHGVQTQVEGKRTGDSVYRELNDLFGYWRNPKEIAARQAQLFHPAWNAQTAAQPMLPGARPMMQSFARNESEMQGVVNDALKQLRKSSPKLQKTAFRRPKQVGLDFGEDDDALEAAMAGLQRSLR